MVGAVSHVQSSATAPAATGFGPSFVRGYPFASGSLSAVCHSRANVAAKPLQYLSCRHEIVLLPAIHFPADGVNRIFPNRSSLQSTGLYTSKHQSVGGSIAKPKVPIAALCSNRCRHRQNRVQQTSGYRKRLWCLRALCPQLSHPYFFFKIQRHLPTCCQRFYQQRHYSHRR